MTTVQKIIKYLAIAFALFLSVSIISGICGALATVSYFFDGEPAGEMAEYAMETECRSLKIDMNAADLEIKTGDRWSLETNHKNITWKETKDTLEIREKGELLQGHSGDRKVILTMPEGTILEDTDINAGAGKVTIDELSTNSLRIYMGAGELQAGKLMASANAIIEGGAGSVTINGGSMRNAEIDMGVGELNLTSELVDRSSIDFGIGEANLVLVGTKKDYQIEFDKGIGEARLEGRKMNDDSVYGFGSNRLEIDGGVGELNITFLPSSGK